MDFKLIKEPDIEDDHPTLRSIAAANEPIKGQGYFWSSESERSYPVPVRILPFESKYTVISGTDAESNIPSTVPKIVDDLKTSIYKEGGSFTESLHEEMQEAFEKVKKNEKFMKKLNSEEVHQSYAAMTIKEVLRDELYSDDKTKYRAALSMIPKFLDTVYGVGVWEEVDGEHKGKRTKFYKNRIGQ